MENRRIYLVGTKTVRLNRADPYVYMHFCNIMAQQGHDVTLVVPKRVENGFAKTLDEVWALYSLERNFNISEIPSWLGKSDNKILLRIQKYLGALFYFLTQMFRNKSDDVIFSFCLTSTLAMIQLKKIGLLRPKIAFMIPEFQSRKLDLYIIRNSDFLITFGDYVYNKLLNINVPKRKIFNGEYITYPEEVQKYKGVSREQFLSPYGIDRSSKIVTYAGKVGPDSKEVNYIIDAAANFDASVMFVVVGVRNETGALPFYEKYIEQNSISNVLLIDYLSVEDYTKMLYVSDILVSYYTSKSDFNKYQRKPAKASPYLCVGRPVIFADLPTLKEFLTDEAVYFVEPDSPEKLSDAITHIFSHRNEANAKAAKCLELADKFSANNVVREMVQFCIRC